MENKKKPKVKRGPDLYYDGPLTTINPELAALYDLWPSHLQDDLQMFVVYRFPLDYPTKFVVRRMVIIEGIQCLDIIPRLGDTIEQARAWIPDHLYLQPRHPSDAFSIMETWL